MGWTKLTMSLLWRGVRQPRLGADLLRVTWRFRRRGWWHRAPFLPLPSRDYVRWRMHTAYGTHDAIPPVEDIVRYARWTGRR